MMVNGMTQLKTKPTGIEARYERARLLMQGIYTKKGALNTTLFPVWLGDSDCFWYERDVRKGSNPSILYGKEYRLVNAKTATNKLAFNHQALADALASSAKQKVDAFNLPIRKVEIDIDSAELVNALRFTAFDKRWLFNIASGLCTEIDIPLSNNQVMSPDGKYIVFSQDNNLWLRTLENGGECPLTTDGEANFVYGATGTAWGHTMGGEGLQVLWSPNSQRIFTVQRDTRQVKALPVVHHVPKDGSIRPQVEYCRFAYQGDEHIETLRLLAIDITSGRQQPASYPQIPVTRNNNGFFTANLGWWANDSRRAYFVDVDRYYKYARVIEFDAETGKTRMLFEETSDTHINLMLNIDELPTFMPLSESNEILWYSERSGWAHFYLYDLDTGKLKNPVTEGDWLVRTFVHFDPQRRELFAQTAGCQDGIDPYYRDLVRINIDTGEMARLIGGDYEVVAATRKDLLTISSGCNGASNAISKTGDFALVTRSRANSIPISVLVDRYGNEIMELETADVSILPDGWQWPEPVKLKAADKVTDIYGLVYRPSDFSSDKSYPVISHLFSTPELTVVPKGSFTNESAFGWFYLDPAALAELGFIVVQIDGRGTPFREKSFHDECYGWSESASNLEDHVSGIQQLAERYPYMDLERVGITTHASGGPGAVQGLLKHPDFYNVGVANQLHDSRMISGTMWGDKYEGPSGPIQGKQYPEELASQLEGKLLLMDGMLDTTAPPAATFRVVEALQKANKDFDLILLPSFGHSVSNYLIRRSWDYLVKHLLGEEPPKDFRLSGVFGEE